MTSLSNLTINPENSSYIANLDVEAHVLGCCMEDGNILRSARERGLDTNCFSAATHRRIFDAICSLGEQGLPVDLLAVAEFCGCDPTIVSTLADCVAGAVIEFSYAMAHVRILKQKRQLRKIARIGELLQEGAAQLGADPELLAASAMSDLVGIGRAL